MNNALQSPRSSGAPLRRTCSVRCTRTSLQETVALTIPRLLDIREDAELTNPLASRILAGGQVAILALGGITATSVGLTSAIIGGSSLQLGISILLCAAVVGACIAFLGRRLIRLLCVLAAVVGAG